MKVYDGNGPPITREIWLLELAILSEILAYTLMDFREFMEDFVLEKEVMNAIIIMHRQQMV